MTSEVLHTYSLFQAKMLPWRLEYVEDRVGSAEYHCIETKKKPRVGVKLGQLQQPQDLHLFYLDMYRIEPTTHIWKKSSMKSTTITQTHRLNIANNLY